MDHTDDRLGEIEKRLEAATGGEWDAVLPGDPRGQPVPYYRGLVCLVEHSSPGSIAVVTKDGRTVPKAEWEANAAFIAHAPEDIRYLLSALKAARDEAVEPMSAAERLGATVDTLGTYKRGVNVGYAQAVEAVTNWMVTHGYPVDEDCSLNTMLFELDRMAREDAAIIALKSPQEAG